VRVNAESLRMPSILADGARGRAPSEKGRYCNSFDSLTLGSAQWRDVVLALVGIHQRDENDVGLTLADGLAESFE